MAETPDLKLNVLDLISTARRIFSAALCFGLVNILYASFVYAVPNSQEEDFSDGIGYEQMVKNISQGENNFSEGQLHHPFDQVKFQVGAAFNQTVFGFTNQAGVFQQISQGGAGINLGVDLMSPRWMAEVHFINYGQQTYGTSQVALREFGLRLTFHDVLSKRWGYFVSSGLIARYLTERGQMNGVGFEREINAPSLLFSAGPRFYFSPTWSIATELAARSPLQDQTNTSLAADFGIRVDGYF